jgi:hypothetical protein
LRQSVAASAARIALLDIRAIAIHFPIVCFAKRNNAPFAVAVRVNPHEKTIIDETERNFAKLIVIETIVGHADVRAGEQDFRQRKRDTVLRPVDRILWRDRTRISRGILYASGVYLARSAGRRSVREYQDEGERHFQPPHFSHAEKTRDPSDPLGADRDWLVRMVCDRRRTCSHQIKGTGYAVAQVSQVSQFPAPSLR